MKVLVTGGSGFIGSHVVAHYQDRAEVVVLDDLFGERLILVPYRANRLSHALFDKRSHLQYFFLETRYFPA